MAYNSGSTKADFSFTIGLNLDDLYNGMERADMTINQSISRLNSENKQVKLRADISELRAGDDAIQKTAIRMEALTRQIEIQTGKLRLLGQSREAAYKDTGKDSPLSRAADTRYLQQEKYLAQLNAELEKLKRTSVQADVASQSLFSHLRSGASEARAGVSRLGDGYTSLSTKAAAALAVMTSAGGLLNITDSSMKAGESIYQLSKRLQMSTSDAALFKRTFDFVGTDVQSVIPFFARLDKAVSNAGAAGNETTSALARFGVTLTDSSGKLLPMNQQLNALAKGYQQARDAGKEAEFTAQVLGARGAQLIPVLEQLEAAQEAAASVKTHGMLNPQEAHEAYIEWKKLQMEAGQLSSAFGAAMLPVAKEIMPEIEESVGNLIDEIKNNKDDITSSIKTFAGALDGVASAAVSAAEAIGKVKNAANGLEEIDVGSGKKESVTNRDRLQYGKNIDKKQLDELYREYGWLDNLVTGIGAGAGLYVGGVKGAAIGGGLAHAAAGAVQSLAENVSLIGVNKSDDEIAAEKMRVELKNQEEQATKSLQEQIKSMNAEQEKSTSITGKNADAMKQAAQAIEYRKTETGKLNEEIYKLTHSDYENSMHDMYIKLEQMTASKEIPQSQIDAYANAYQEQMQRKMQSSLLNPISDAFKTDLQKSLDDIDRQADEYKRQWRGAGQDGKIDAWANHRKSQINADWDKQVASQIDSIWKSSYQNRIDEIEREKAAWEKKGLDEVKATQFAEEQKRQLMQTTAQSMFTSEKKYYQVWKKAGGQESGQAGIDAIANQMRREKGIPSNAFTTPGEIQAFESAMKAANSELVPIVADGTYQGTKAAMLEVWRGTNLTGANAEIGQEGQYQPTFTVPAMDFSGLAPAISQAVTQANTSTIEVLKGTMMSTVQVAQSSTEAEISSYRVWTEQEAQQILQAADHTSAAFTSGETWFNHLGEVIEKNTGATDEQTKAMMNSTSMSGNGKESTEVINSLLSKATDALDQTQSSNVKAAMDVVKAVTQSGTQTRAQLQKLQAAQQKVRQEIYRTTNIYPRYMTNEQIVDMANKTLGVVNEEIAGTSAQNSY